MLLDFSTFYLFIFCLLYVLRTLSKFGLSLFSNNPIPILTSKNDLLFFGLSLSYVITYIVKIYHV